MPAARRAAPLALVPAVALAGCFLDPGAPGQATTDDATTQPGASTSSDPTTGPAPDPTTSTGVDATGSTSTGDVADTAAPGCGEPDACRPGTTALSDVACDPCGRRGSTCQDDCSWSAETCVPTVDACAYWTYGPIGGLGAAWTALPRGPLEPNAPAGAVEAAVELPEDDAVLVFAGEELHVLDADFDEWEFSGPTKAVFPHVEGVVTHAFGNYEPALESYALTLIAGQTAYYYDFLPAPAIAQLDGSGPCCADWNDAASPDLDSVRDVMLDLGNASGWGAGDVMKLCGTGRPTPLDYFAAWIGPAQVHLQDMGYCGLFLAPPLAYADFGPFGAPGAPPGALVGGVALLGEYLYVFPGA